jgi:hypothetical protein
MDKSITGEAAGAYPFRTGISAIRIALANVVEKIKMYISNAQSDCSST